MTAVMQACNGDGAPEGEDRFDPKANRAAQEAAMSQRARR